MSVRNLRSLFAPASVALIGASRKANAVGAVVARNLAEAGLQGELMFVNPAGGELHGRPLYANIEALPRVPELAVIATPPAPIPDLIDELAKRGTKAAVVLTAGFAEMGEDGRQLQQRMLDAARPHTLRIIGPNCIGVLAPKGGLNASFAHCMAPTGRTAFVTQSGAMLTAVLDWAIARGIGFSHLVSMGGMSDIDFGDMLDYLAAEPGTDAVLLYIESVTQARKFMSAARRCARVKPVIVVKSGRHAEGARAARSHTGALAGSDAVADAAFRRAGLIRVLTIDDLFGALEALSTNQRVTGDRLAILTNGGGAGVLATDHLIDEAGKLAQLSPTTVETLNRLLPVSWSKANPVDIIGDAGPDRYRAALEALMADDNADAVLVLNCPVAVADSTAAAETVVSIVRAARDNGNAKPVFTAWLGEAAVAGARKLLDEGGLPGYATPEKAVTAMMQLVRRMQAQEMLMQIPPATVESERNTKPARAAIDAALAAGRDWLTAVEANTVLQAYGIPTVDLRVATTPEEAHRTAVSMGFPVALKILSTDIVHKSDIGAVALNLKDGPSVARAAATMLLRIGEAQPDARIDGFIVQPMASRAGAHELILGLSEDPLFGPVILFGQGGTAVEVVNDQAVALPPLNAILAHDMIGRTRVARLLKGYRDRPQSDMNAIVKAILALQDIAIDLPEVKELDINPLWANDQGVLALDARIRVAKEPRPGTDRFAIKPYPAELARQIEDRNGRPYLMRPIKPEDAGPLQDTIASSDPEDVRMRFFSTLQRLPDILAKRLTQIDYDREMAFAVIDESGELPQGVGVVRLALDPDRTRGEYAVMVRSDRIGTGLGYRLMQEIIAYARTTGAKQIFGDVLAENARMLGMCAKLGFERTGSPEPGVVEVTLNLENESGTGTSIPAPPSL
ncbi:MAG: bifunctional acetate--CoA ligase family protein/GNAT family N-acetyltransferase [Alphaproteobacteria bacterium]|nr:bifunctional acetate--CoA ligase family protein/GNAT family N-acetyltransferase [Alphaproteobacteria bacterium]